MNEIFNRNIWYVLQKIKRNNPYNQADFPIKYTIHFIQENVNIKSSQEECEILKKLTEWKVINISRRELKPELRILVYLTILQPRFDEIFKIFETLYERNCNVKPIPQQINSFHKVQDLKEDISLQFNLQLEKTILSSYFLKRELDQFELTLKYFYEVGAVTKEDYEFLTSNSKMVKNFLSRNNVYKKKRKPQKRNQIISGKQQPLPITGEIVVSGLKEGFESLKTIKDEKRVPKFPYKIPAGTHWNNVIIKFLDDERIEIWVKKQKHVTDYKEMGMIGKGKIPEPSEQWLFMKVLAKCHGEITIKDPEAKEKYKKQKQALTETLRSYFSIDYDPFYPYQSSLEKGGNSYKIKLLLIPPLIKNKIEQKQDNEETDTLGIHEYLNETAPQVIEY